MYLKIYTCDYLNHGGGGITDEMTIIYTHDYLNKKQTHRLSDTFCVGCSAFFILFLLCILTTRKKQVSMIRKYHNHTLQTMTRPYIIMHSIKQRNQFHFERKLYAQKRVSVSVPFVPNVVVEHVSGFVVCCVETWVMWNTILVSVYAIRVIYSQMT